MDQVKGALEDARAMVLQAVEHLTEMRGTQAHFYSPADLRDFSIVIVSIVSALDAAIGSAEDLKRLHDLRRGQA